MPDVTQLSPLIRFESFQVDLRLGQLSRNGQKIKLPEQSFQILKMLLERNGELVTRQEIQKRLWPNDTVVEFENSINAAIKRLRLVLEDSADQPRYIETLARRGYRWMVPVERVAPLEPSFPVVVVPPPSQAAASNYLGKRVSHYRVLEILGGGGMGVVYKAEDLKLGRRVALKFLPEELANDTAAMERFEREARAASAINHPNICTIYAVEEHQGQPFIVMELLEGRTLRDSLCAAEEASSGKTHHKSPLPLEQLFDIGCQIAEGLGAAHKAGIIHRDIKPANIFLSTQAHVKILDFGLAKLQESGVLEEGTGAENNRYPERDLHLTRTGAAMGTAGYMSPEQARGEKVDSRTDIFNFGLVLYEMAAGQRAFSGETAPLLREAILNRTPEPIRQLNPEVPPRLEQIIKKALEKDRESRYQFASEIQSDLKEFFKVQQAVPLNRTVLAATAFGLILLVGTILWFSNRQPPSMPEVNQRELTVNSSQDAIVSGAISADGKYLAYADLKGIHIKSLDSGETRNVPQPEELRNVQVNWGIVPTWVRDGTKIIANANVPGRQHSVWAVPVTGGLPQKLRDDATAWSVSRDGLWVAFSTDESTFGDREMWRMSPEGDRAQKLYDAGENSGFTGAEWSPDGRRLAYVKFHETRERAEFSVQTRDLEGGPAVVAIQGFEMDFSWSPDGRIIYVLEEPGSAGESCNFWAVRIDSRSGQPLEKPRRLTDWAGFCMDNPSVSADGKRLTFRRWLPQGSVYVSNLVSGTRITAPRRLTLNDEQNYPAEWTPDSEAVVFRSYRDGQWRILKQRLDEDSAVAVVNGADAGAAMGARVSPDGAWILYTAASEGKAPPDAIPMSRLMRVPIQGGTPALVLNARLPDYGVYHDPVCGKTPSSSCIITEQTADRKQLIFTAFDPVKGRGRELARYDITWPGAYDWDLSPDGSRLAILKYSGHQIHILALNRESASDVVVKGWSSLQSLNWAADGKSLFVSSATQTGSALLRVDLQGNARVLWEQKGSIAPWGLPFDLFIGPSAPWAVPSPDGRHIAIYEWKLNANLWMMENF